MDDKIAEYLDRHAGSLPLEELRPDALCDTCQRVVFPEDFSAPARQVRVCQVCGADVWPKEET